MPSDVCAATVIATEESIRASSSMAIAYESVSPPAPPHSLGDRQSPSDRAPRAPPTSSYGKRCSRSSSSASGATRLFCELPDGAPGQLVLFTEVEFMRSETLC